MQPVPLSRRKFISEILMALLVICVVLLHVFGRTKPALKSGMLNQTMNIPEGIVAIDADIRLLDPAPFPSYRLRDEWKRLLQTADGNLS